MTAQPVFDPARSAAIRDLLVQTVTEGASRRRPSRFALVAILTGVALALAGGTAALALSGVIRFGAPEPAPAPVPTPTVSPTTTPTPTPSPTRTLVASAPIAPHDVDSLTASPRWSLDLAGGDPDCTGTTAYNLSDGRALYMSGVRPKEYEGAPGTEKCLDQPEHIVLTLVDTEHGGVLWTREWSFRNPDLSPSPSLLVLGTSGRAVIDNPVAETGPHEVLELASGSTVAPFRSGIAGFRLAQDAVAVADTSGDLVTVDTHEDADGRPGSATTVSRVDPRDAGAVRWTTEIDGSGQRLMPPVDSTVGVAIEYYRGSEAHVAFLDSATGRATESTARSVSYVVGPAYLDYTSETVTGYAADGRRIWSVPLPPKSAMLPALASAAVPGLPSWSSAAPGFVIVDADSVRLMDAADGTRLWSAPMSGCSSGQSWWPETVRLDAAHDAVILGYGAAGSCRFALADGTRLADIGLTIGSLSVLGDANTYDAEAYRASEGTAVDLSTGRTLWTRPIAANEHWSFDGGYLTSHRGNHVESIG